MCEAERVVSSKERLWRVSPRPSMTLSSQVTLGSSVPAGCHTAALVLSATKMCNSEGVSQRCLDAVSKFFVFLFFPIFT